MDWNKFLEQILSAMIPILVPFICALIVAQIKIMLAKLKADRPDLAALAEGAARFAVLAVEQLKKTGAIETAEQAKQYAMESAQRWLDAKGVGVDLALLDDAVESAVWEYINSNEWVDEELFPPEPVS
jgi:hypothetical protein